MVLVLELVVLLAVVWFGLVGWFLNVLVNY